MRAAGRMTWGMVGARNEHGSGRNHASLGCLCVPASRAKQAAAGYVQSKAGRLRQKMITFDYIEIYFSGSGEDSRERLHQEGSEGSAKGRRFWRERRKGFMFAPEF
jgi:hypothetical protein